MGFWSSLGKGLTGGAAGLLIGGPAGAAVGAASGLMSGGGNSSTGAQTSTRSVDLRNMTPEERAQHERSSAGLLGASSEMSVDEIEASRNRNYEALYGRASGEIEQRGENVRAGLTSSAARRGAAVSSAGMDRELLSTASEQRELGRASQDATVGAEQLLLQERADRRASAAAYQQQLDSIWNKRLSTSAVTTTGTTESTSPDTFWQYAAAGLGSSVTNKESWLNKKGGSALINLFGA